MRRRSGFSDFIEGFTGAYNLGNRISMDIGLSRAADVKPETVEEVGDYTKTMGLTGADDQAKMLQEQDAGFGAEGARSTATALNANAADTTTASPVKTSYRMGGMAQNEPFTDGQIAQHRLREMSDVALRFGDPVQAAQFDALAYKRRDLADQDEVRRLLAGDRPQGLERVPVAGQQAAPGQPGLQTQDYLSVVTPRVTEAYLRQGKIAEAKAWRDFSESEQGRAYANEYATAQRLVTAGDYDAAAPVLERLYNRGHPDGRQAKLTSLGDGNFKLDMFDQASGNQIGSKTMPAADMGKMAIGALSPTKLVEFTVEQNAKREAEDATLRRLLTLEQVRQDGADRRLGRQLAARHDGGLTLTQQRTNYEIDSARELVDGLSDDEIRQRTTPSTASGRDNPLYDGRLAAAAKLAGRRKIGADDWFDQRQGRQPDTFMGKPMSEMTGDQLQRFGRVAGPQAQQKIDAELTRRQFAGDQAMQGHTLGEMTAKGYKVFDTQGRHVGYYRR